MRIEGVEKWGTVTCFAIPTPNRGSIKNDLDLFCILIGRSDFLGDRESVSEPSCIGFLFHFSHLLLKFVCRCRGMCRGNVLIHARTP